MTPTRLLRIGLFATLIGLIALGWQRSRPEPVPDPSADDVLPPGGDFTITTAEGPLSLSDLSGQVVAVYFGYRSCPDICPTSLSLLGRGLDRLTDDEVAQVTGLFISVDPDRDPPDLLDDYAGYFHPRILGGTTSEEALAALGPRYGAAWSKVPMEDSSMGYAVDHTSWTVIVGRDGRIAERLIHGTGPDEVAAALRRALGTAPATSEAHQGDQAQSKG